MSVVTLIYSVLKPITYKVKTYYFEYGKPVNYYPAFKCLIFDLTPDVISTFKDVILGSDKILSIPRIKYPHGLEIYFYHHISYDIY
jgi:hypothetical protein